MICSADIGELKTDQMKFWLGLTDKNLAVISLVRWGIESQTDKVSLEHPAVKVNEYITQPMLTVPYKRHRNDIFSSIGCCKTAYSKSVNLHKLISNKLQTTVITTVTTVCKWLQFVFNIQKINQI